MAAILPAVHVDADAAIRSRFLPYQVAWILDQSRMALAEKSVRIGWTYADAFRNVRKRLHHAKRDYLFASKDQASALEYLDLCKNFIEIYNAARNVLASGEDSIRVQHKDAAGATVTEEVKFGYIKFTNGSRIIAFSANPYAMAVFGGDVGLDEFAKHSQAEKLWETAQGRVTWGYDIGVWSAHDGTDTLFYQFSREAAAGRGGWTHYKVTIEDAVDLGLVEKINEVAGTSTTREEFLEAAKTRARLPEIYQQAYMCNPSGSASAIVPWASIGQCRRVYDLDRWHLEAAQITTLFGPYNPDAPGPRADRVRDAIAGAFPRTFSTPAHRRLGFDVAASGKGDLCAIYVDVVEEPRLRLDALFTCRTDDWDFIERVLWTFLGLGALQASGDETGLGRQICWRSAQRFPWFQGVNFSREKHAMGHALMNQLSLAEKVFPADAHDDIAQDFFSLRKTFAGGRWIFTEGTNTLNPASHCDIAWAGALASHAAARQDADALAPGDIQTPVPTTGSARFTPRRL